METKQMDQFLTRHARLRARQRGARLTAVGIVYAHADMEIAAGSGCVRRFLSRQSQLELIRGGHGAQQIGQAARLELVVAQDGRVVTVIKRNPSSGPRRIEGSRRLHTWRASHVR